MATGAVHYATAEGGSDTENYQLRAAQVHATLALAAATALAEGGMMPLADAEEWIAATAAACVPAGLDPALVIHDLDGTGTGAHAKDCSGCEFVRAATGTCQPEPQGPALVWWLDDGGDSPEPELYTTETAAQQAAVAAWKAANPFTQITNLEWLYVDSSIGDPHADTELNINHQYTGHVVRARMPKGAVA